MGFFGRKKKSAKADLSSGEGTANNTTDNQSHAKKRNPTLTSQYVELGTIEYVNLTADGKHGDYDTAVREASETGRPIFANFVEWSGWQGCKDAGRIFADPVVKRAAEELFVPCAFNTWDRGNSKRNKPFRKWGAGLANSWWGYLRIVDPEGNLVLSGTRQITGYRQIEDVKQVMREALEDLGEDIPDYLA